MGLGLSLSKERSPQPGDHVFCRRVGGLYDHHGIYVGDDMVIHLQGAAESSPYCHRCGNKRVQNGEIEKVCIGCFLEGTPIDGKTLLIYDYGVSHAEFMARQRGTCCKRNSKPSHEVIRTATDLLERNGFGPYDMFDNNCEHFAVYCKTGFAESYQINSGGLAGGPISMVKDTAFLGAQIVSNGLGASKKSSSSKSSSSFSWKS